MNRRRFLSVLAAGVAAAAVDPEQLLWVPGEKTHILPPPQGWRPDSLIGDAIRMQREYNALDSARLDALYGLKVVSKDPAHNAEAEVLNGILKSLAKEMAEKIDAEIARQFYFGGAMGIPSALMVERHGDELRTIQHIRNAQEERYLLALPSLLGLRGA